MAKRKKSPPLGDDQNILTHEDLEKVVPGGSSPGTIEEKDEPVKKKKKIPKDVKFECPFAPPGKSKTVLTYYDENKKLMKLELPMENKIYTIPNDLSDKEKTIIRQVLLKNGFKDVTKIDAGVKFSKKKGKYTYTVMHPEHSDRNPINGNISLFLTDETGRPVFDEKTKKQIFKQVSIVNGIVTTDDEKVYQALLKAGFYSGHKKVRAE